MNIPAGLVIMGVICLIYVYDSTYLLYRNEAIVVAKFRGRYSVEFGSSSFLLFGKYVYIPNLLFAHRPIYRILWDTVNQETDMDAPQITGIAKFNLLNLAPYIWLMLFCIFILLPVGFYVPHGIVLVLAALACFYLTTITLITLLTIKKKILGIDTIRFIGICFESLVCAPCALNIIKKTASLNRVHADLIELSRTLLSPSHLTDFHRELVAKIDDQLISEPEGSLRYEQLKAYRQSIVRQVV